MKIENGSRYTLNRDNLNLHYLVSISNYHNISAIKKINGINISDIPGFENENITMFDLPDVINQFPTSQPFIVECDNAGQTFTHIFNTLSKHTMEAYEHLHGAWQFKLPNGELSNAKNIYSLNHSKFIFTHDGSLYITDKTHVEELKDVAFDVDEGFYSKRIHHPCQVEINILQTYYEKFCANKGLEMSVVDNVKFSILSEKELDEFYKKEFGGCIFSAAGNAEKLNRVTEPTAKLSL